MSLTPHTFRFLSYLRKRKYLPELRRVLDLGAQDMACSEGEPELEEFVKTFAPDAEFTKSDLTLASYGNATSIFKLINCEYETFDVAQHPYEGTHSQTFDLNFDKVPELKKLRYDYITNHGVTEHVFNQVKSFEVMHDLTAVGGVMMHNLPFLAFFDGLYFLSPGSGKQLQNVRAMVHRVHRSLV